VKRTLTDPYVKTLKSPERRLEVWDTEQRCFGLRVTENGIKTWTLKYKHRGRQRRMNLGYYPETSLANARKFARQKLGELAKGEDPGASKDTTPEATFADLVRAYLDRHAKLRNKEVSWQQDEQIIRDYIPAAWRRRELSSFKQSEISRLHSEVGKKSIYAANHTLRLLKSMFYKAPKFEMFSGVNPAVGVDLFKEKMGTRFLSTEEMRRMIGALQEEVDVLWRTYFMVVLMLGTRRSELLAVRWTDIDFEQQLLRLPETKSGREHILPLPGAALQLLASLPRRNDFVFSGTGETGHRVNVKRAWKRICDRAGVRSCRVHDLRHTVGSWLSMAGCNLQLVKQVLNHASTAVTERYTHLSLGPVRTVLEANARAMFALSVEAPTVEVKALPAPLTVPAATAS
jgi:integrase